MPLHELVEALEDTSRIVSLEKMKRRYLDHQSKEMVSRFTHHILITTEGNELPKMIKIYNGLTAVRIRSFVEPVKQCYNCYRFGHLKATCRIEKLCLICGDKFHGICNKEAKCINCGKNHKATNKICSTIIYNMNLKKIMAERNISIQEAKTLLRNPSIHDYQLNYSNRE